MAYLAFDPEQAAHAAPIARVAPVPAAAAESVMGFSAVEWAVVRLARHDGLASLKATTRAGRALRALFGLPAANRLADPKLEALRRAAVRCWNRDRALDREMIDGLLAAGFRFDQIALLATCTRA